MKLSKTLVTFLLITLCFSACREDEYFNEETETPIGTGVIVEGNLNGLVLNSNNNPVSNALIEVMGETTETDANGFFRFKDIPIDKDGSLVKISKEGRFDGFKFAYTEPGEDSYIKHIFPAQGGAQYPNTSGYTIPVNGGAEIIIPPNSVVYPDGSAYNDRVYVNHIWYDPSDPNLAAFMPGDLRGIADSGEPVQLVTYGMIAVELETATGEPLQISESLPATLKFPIPENFPTQDTIPMWHLNENTGYWIEEGYAVKEGNMMVAEVTHFSFWNCDAPFPLINLEGTLVNQNGSPLSNQLISITTDNMMTGTGHTNENGHFRGKVPQGRNLLLSLNVCEDDAYTIDLGSFDTDTDLEEIVIDIANKITVTTRLVDCMDLPITGYAFIRTDISTEVVATDEDGFISYELLTCNEGEGTIQGINAVTGVSSDITNFALSNPDANLGNLTVCGTGVTSSSITFDIAGQETMITDVDVVIVDETYLYIYGEGENSAPELEYIQLMFLIEGKSHIPEGEDFLLLPLYGGFTPQGEYLDIQLNPALLADIQSTPVQNVGDPLIGALSSADISFNLMVTQKVNTSAIAGIRWIDLNQDGIQQPDEPVSTDLTDFKAVGRDPNQRLIRYYRGMPSDTDGSYMIHGLVPDEEYKLTWGTGIENIDVSPANQGTEEKRDSDFVLNSDNIYETEYFLVGEEETIEDVGFGYNVYMSCQITPRCCPVNGMYFHIMYGVAPYTVNLISPSLVYAPWTFNQDEFGILTEDGDYGTYEIEVTDSQGSICNRTYEHNEFLNSITGQTWIDDGDIPGQFDSNDGAIEDIEINLYNDEGALVSTTYADPNGRYLFSNFDGDSYRIQVIIPNEYEFIELGNQDEFGENHVDPQTGYSHFINVGNWDYDIVHTLNAGFREK